MQCHRGRDSTPRKRRHHASGGAHRTQAGLRLSDERRHSCTSCPPGHTTQTRTHYHTTAQSGHCGEMDPSIPDEETVARELEHERTFDERERRADGPRQAMGAREQHSVCVH
uniref:Uncharacterized protein n=1 Tax=Cacopsylla melanoneura TaxID=428564 RepID=A0A8D8VQP5_9HEMI